MKNILLITRREFLTQVKKRSFIILTVLSPLLLVIFGLIMAVMTKSNETVYHFNIIDKSGLFENKMLSSGNITYLSVPLEFEKAQRSSIKEMEDIDGLLVIPELKDKDYKKMLSETELIANKNINIEIRSRISDDISKIVREQKIKNFGLTSEEMESLSENFSIKIINVKNEKSEDSNLLYTLKSSLGFLLMYVVFIFIMIYSVRIMRSVLEEKNSRIVEIIISSVKPFELMVGKILGVTGVALLQFGIWFIMILFALMFSGNTLGSHTNTFVESEEKIQHVVMVIRNISQLFFGMEYGFIIIFFFLYFLLGYLFYSSIYAAIGSCVDNEADTQQFTVFTVIPLILGFYGGFAIINNPEGPMGFWLSMIPFTSPVSMMARIPFGVPLWELGLSLFILVISTLLMIHLAGRIYRIGILSYGGKISLKEIWKWMKA